MNRISEQELQEALHRLPRERDPGKDLWPGIEARLDSRPASEQTVVQGRAISRFAIAASLALAVVVAYQVGLQRGQVITTENIVMAAETYRLESLSNEYLGAIREAAALTAQQKDTRMPDETVEELQTSMTNILLTEAKLREALKADPDNEFLAMLLIKLQSRQLELIQEIPQIEQQIWRTL